MSESYSTKELVWRATKEVAWFRTLALAYAFGVACWLSLALIAPETFRALAALAMTVLMWLLFRFTLRRLDKWIAFLNIAKAIQRIERQFHPQPARWPVEVGE